MLSAFRLSFHCPSSCLLLVLRLLLLHLASSFHAGAPSVQSMQSREINNVSEKHGLLSIWTALFGWSSSKGRSTREWERRRLRRNALAAPLHERGGKKREKEKNRPPPLRYQQRLAEELWLRTVVSCRGEVSRTRLARRRGS
ncbi:hypothetical protein IWX46DRAFT_451106 [Phyllosticta citricarpa]|uniref:Secreted protein n=1 Tax=Phyllosticta citricarpa TaxID=55181 RepID=A0ABR1MI50_9PEZI